MTTVGICFGDSPTDVDKVISALKDDKGRATPLPVAKMHNQTGLLNRMHDAWGDSKTTYVLRATSTEHIIDRGVSSWQDPKIVARQWFDAMQPLFSASPYAHFEVGGPGFNTDDPAFAKHYAATIEAAMRLMGDVGLRGVVLSFFEGCPHTLSDGSGIDGWAPYRTTINLAAQLGFILGMQGYWVDGKMAPDDDWHNYRLMRVIRDYPGMFPPGTRFLKTEGGIDLRTNPPKGWKTALSSDAKKFMGGIKAEDEYWQNAPMPNGCTYVGTAYFILQLLKDGWGDFNLTEVLPYMLPYVRDNQGPVLPPEPPEDPDTTVLIGMKTPADGWLNVRSGPGWLYSKISKFYASDRMLLSGEARANIGVEGSWVWCDGTLADPNKMGWVAAWLLKEYAQ